MRKVLVICLGYLCTCTHAVVSHAHDLLDWDRSARRDVFGKFAFTEPPELSTFNDLRRRDLLAGQMPAQAAPTQQATRPRSDQRPWLNRFLLPRNDFAFA